MPELAALREEIAGLRAAAVAATKTAHLNRRTIRWLTAVTVLLVAACVWLAFVAVAARDAEPDPCRLGHVMGACPRHRRPAAAPERAGESTR